MNEILRYINENLNQRLTLRDVAKRAGYSTWHFCEKFKEITGLTFVEYVTQKRMQLAALDIAAGKKLIDIANDYGYDSVTGFNKAFFKEFGCTPSHYKKNSEYYKGLYKERKAKMRHLSDRCHILRERYVDTKEGYDQFNGQRIYNYVKGYFTLQPHERTNAMIAAACTGNVIKCAQPVIFDDELIVGYNYNDEYLEAYAFYEYLTSPDRDKKQHIISYLKRGLLTEGQINELDYLVNNTKDPFRPAASFRYFQNDEEYCPFSEAEIGNLTEFASVGFCLTNNHTVLGYEQVLKYGFEGLLQQAEAAQKACDDPSPAQEDFYRSVYTICSAARHLGENYAKKAREMAAACTDERRKAELEEIAKTCQQVPRYPARTLREAIQSLWFAHIINTWEDGINANSLGRLDQILYPYYKNDIQNGLLTEDEAFELIASLFLKLYRDYDVQQSTVGGCDAQGNCAVNELSWMMLDAVEALDFVRCMSVRFSKNTPAAFIKRALEVVGHVQKGIPFFFNDDVMIPALTSHGIALTDAYDYCAIGCVETVIPGKSNPHAVTARANLLKAMEYALNNGESMVNKGLLCGPRTGNPESFETFEQLKAAVFKHIKFSINTACRVTNMSIPYAAENNPLPYKSLLTKGCLQKGMDFNAGGPKYNYYQCMLLGIPNLADSLAAIKTLVYDRKLYTMGQLIDQLKNNWPDEAARLDFVNKAPKYGNDLEEADVLAAEIFSYACDCVSQVKSVIGDGFHAQPFTFLWMVDHGNTTAATPDGRRSGEILAYSVSPMQGRDFNGFTALLNSIAKLPAVKAPGTASAIVEVDPLLFTDQNLDRFADIFITASKNGLANVQFNVIDKDTLIEAQKHPEKYRNLAVRVSGFSQKFNLLDKKIQDHIIARTKHKTL